MLLVFNLHITQTRRIQTSLKKWEFFNEKANKAIAETEQLKRENAALVAHNAALARRIQRMEETIAAAADVNYKLRSRIKSAVVDAMSIIEQAIK